MVCLGAFLWFEQEFQAALFFYLISLIADATKDIFKSSFKPFRSSYGDFIRRDHLNTLTDIHYVVLSNRFIWATFRPFPNYEHLFPNLISLSKKEFWKFLHLTFYQERFDFWRSVVLTSWSNLLIDIIFRFGLFFSPASMFQIIFRKIIYPW